MPDFYGLQAGYDGVVETAMSLGSLTDFVVPADEDEWRSDFVSKLVDYDDLMDHNIAT